MSATSVIDSDVPLHVLVEYMPAVYSAQYKLSRCLLALNRAQPSAADMRRLGSLRRSAQVTVRQLQQALEAHEGKAAPTGSGETVEQQHAALSDEAQFFSQRMPDVCRTLEEGIRESGLLLERHVVNVTGSPILPVSCVGARIESVPTARTAKETTNTPQKLAVFHDPEVYKVQEEKVTTERVMNATAQPVKSTAAKAVAAPAASKAPSHSPAHPTSVLPASATSAEDEVLDDIKNVIGQMKQGALQMNTLMQRDVEALRTSEKLLQDGLLRSKRNIDSMDKLTGDSSSSYGGGGKGNGLLRRIPGGVFIWRSFLLPLWEVVKQAIYMCCILAATAFVVFVMLMMPKPKTFARKEPKVDPLPSPVAPTSAPPIPTSAAPAAAAAVVPPRMPDDTATVMEAAKAPSDGCEVTKEDGEGVLDKSHPKEVVQEDDSASQYGDEEDEEEEEDEVEEEGEEPSNHTEAPIVMQPNDHPSNEKETFSPSEEQNAPTDTDYDNADL